MTILITGGTGTVGSQVLKDLAGENVDVRALARNPSKLARHDGIEAVEGDMTDVNSMREALRGVDTLFLINAVVPDEATQALLTIELAREAGVRGIVYFSVVNSALFQDVPHFAAKHLAERVIEAHALPASIIRNSYFMQNDAAMRDAIEAGTYPSPIGSQGVAMVDVRDISDVIVAELLRRERSAEALPQATLDVAGPEDLTGNDVASIWASVLGREVRYGGDDLDAFESQAAAATPGWQALDMKLMYRGFQTHGLKSSHPRAALEDLIGHPLRTYRQFAEETAKTW